MVPSGVSREISTSCPNRAAKTSIYELLMNNLVRVVVRDPSLETS